MAAFDACLSANDLQPAQSYASQFDAQVASQQEMKVCGDKIPPEVIKKWQKQAEAGSSSYRECIKNLAGSQGGGGFGRFRGGPSVRASGTPSPPAGACFGGAAAGGGGGTPVPKKPRPGRSPSSAA